MNRAYLRVSTEEQSNSGLGLEAQEEAIRRAVGDVGRVYTDAGYSGSNPARPALLALLQDLEDGDVLVVARRDRLARDVFLSAWVEKEARKRGARVLSAAGEGTQEDGPAGVLLRQIVDAFAEYERNIIAARTAAAMQAKRQRREYCGGVPPFGWRVEGGRLVEDLVEQEALVLVQELRDRGCTLRQIAAHLQAQGIRTKKGGTVWHPKVLADVLRLAA